MVVSNCSLMLCSFLMGAISIGLIHSLGFSFKGILNSFKSFNLKEIGFKLAPVASVAMTIFMIFSAVHKENVILEKVEIKVVSCEKKQKTEEISFFNKSCLLNRLASK